MQLQLPLWKRLLWNVFVACFLPAFLLCALIPGRRQRTYFIWGSVPLINNKYFSEAIRQAGHLSMTLMAGHYAINARSDFDRYFEDFAPRFLPQALRVALGGCIAFMFALRRAAVMHMSFNGFTLGSTMFWRLEGALFRLAGAKIVILPFGSDFYMYSRLLDTSLQHGLLASYPGKALEEGRVERGVRYWSRRADALVSGMMVDGIGRWDVTLNQFFCIDTDAWVGKTQYSDHDGKNGPVRILHTPNHRGFKGTEFLVDAAERLKQEGLQLELVLLEGVPNSQVKQAMAEVDVLAEQFIATGYAISGIEGMASGLPVMANLEHPAYTRVFRRFGFLDECPIFSTTPETVLANLRTLVTNPQLRRALGEAGRQFAEKYHSYEMARYLFGSIYDKILHGKDVDLINLFHPLKSDYNRRTPRVSHPLVENQLPPNWRPDGAESAR